MDERLDIRAATMSTNDGPARVAAHGQAGTGKTLLACYFPKPIVIGAENGIPRDLGFEVPVVRPRSWLQTLDVVASLTGDAHDYETAVIDTVDWLEPMLHEFVCRRDSERETEMNKKGKPLISIEDYGYGRGYLAAEEEFLRLLTALDVLQYRRRMHVVMLMHTIVRTFKNPAGPDFDRYEPKCHQRISAKIVEWSESFLFLHFRRDAGKISEDKERHKEHAKAKGIEGVAERLIGCQDSALFDAKNRVRMPAVIAFTDPNLVVAQLLGDHLGRKPPAVADRNARASIASNAPTQRGEPTVGNDPQGARAFVDNVIPAAQRFADAARNAPQTREPLGVPAHHESRQVDEKARQDDAFARARGAVEERDARRNAHPNAPGPNQDPMPTRGPGNDPPHSGNPPAGATSNGPSRADANARQRQGAAARFDQDNDLMRRLADAVKRGEALGPQYRADMKIWQERAADDAKSSRADKLERIIVRINADVAKAEQPTAAR